MAELRVGTSRTPLMDFGVEAWRCCALICGGGLGFEKWEGLGIRVFSAMELTGERNLGLRLREGEESIFSKGAAVLLLLLMLSVRRRTDM